MLRIGAPFQARERERLHIKRTTRHADCANGPAADFACDAVADFVIREVSLFQAT